MIAPQPSPSDRPRIGLIRELCRALDDEQVQYCHFKSNAFLDRTRSGDNDLDLLVRRADGDRFAALLHRMGFKLARHPSRSLPGVVDYYGHDEGSQRLVHVHAHYQLIVGDDLTKNYRIPLETAFLAAAQRDGELMIPPPELELILLVVRLVLKHATWDAMALRVGGIPRSARAELDFLRERADLEEMHRFLEVSLPRLDRKTFAACLRAVEPDAGRRARVRAGRRLVAALEPCARRSRAADVRLKLSRRATGIARRIASRPPRRKLLLAGGGVIAVVGADGAGKSTAVEALHGWLSQGLAVTRVHLGRPPRSRTTRVVRTLVRASEAPRVLVRGRHSTEAWHSGAVPTHPLLAVALARDRYLASRYARRIATNGGLVISDRFPLPELEMMDAPRLAAAGGGRLTALCASLERRYYGAMIKPDLLIVLRVDPEVAVARKPEEPADFVRRRWREIWGVDWQAVPAHVVDAGRPKEEVLAQLRSLVWDGV